MDTTLLMLALLVSIAVNLTLSVILVGTVRASSDRPARRVAERARPAPVVEEESPEVVPRRARRVAIIELAKRGLPRPSISAITGAALGEVDLVLSVSDVEPRRDPERGRAA